MSSPATPSPISRTERRRRFRREQVRPAILIVLAILLTLFAVFNFDQVRVHWVVATSRAPLIVVIAIAVLIGFLLGRFGERGGKKSKK